MRRLWLDSDCGYSWYRFISDRDVYLPYYLDDVELGARVSDYLNGPELIVTAP